MKSNSNEYESPQVAPLRRELVGNVWVDSGHLVITDPSYAGDLDCETIEGLTSLKQRFAVINEGMAVVVRSGLRSGKYPVYVTRFENGAISKVEIELTEMSK